MSTFFDYNRFFDEQKMREAKVAYYALTTCNEDDPNRTIFSEYHDGGSTTGTFMVRWNLWKFVYYVGHPSQLFDLKADPDELNNLAMDKTNDSTICAAWKEGERRLRDICDPESVNAQCFLDQKRRIEELGGRDACISSYVFNHTPTPTEQRKLTEMAISKATQE